MVFLDQLASEKSSIFIKFEIILFEWERNNLNIKLHKALYKN